ncbi:hypothetical protein U3A55_01270 [Salarchaeum sp. III]|uniref:hypothetical protein n=1 Tax=Salarchaeum sp. III TaxID=3107927 RepID=UPI002EDA8CCE
MADVTYYCPRCETLATVERDAYLADKSVTPYPLEGWSYESPTALPHADADGVRFVCGESDGVEWSADGCGEPFYLNFVRHDEGREIESEPTSEYVELNVGSSEPRGPRGPGGPTP